MKLPEIIANDLEFEIKSLTEDIQLTNDIQQRLISLGILDPPADGDFGQVSKLALQQFAKKVNIQLGETINADLAQALIESNTDTFLPLDLSTNFESRIIKYMQLKKYWFARLPGYFNIVYVEGANKDGSINNDEPDIFNDRRIVIEFEDGKPKFRGNFQATTEPGKPFTINPVNPKGAARIAFDQFKAWRVGFHHGLSGTDNHEALVQVDKVTVHRDLDKNFVRTGDKTDVGSSFGINQHAGHKASGDKIGKSSAGCLVGNTDVDHKEFMKIIKADLRFKKASQGYKFITTVIAGDDLKKLVG